MFPINIRPKKYNEDVDYSLAALKNIPDWFVTSKMIKELFTALYAEENILFLMKILVMSCFLVIKWVFLI